MAMTDALDDVCYEKRNFNYHPRNGRHPMWVTERHYVYPLCVDNHNRLICTKNAFGNPYRTPRRLDCTCIYKMVTEGYLQTILKDNNMPSYLYPAMLSEAILQREGAAIVQLISRWALKYLCVYEILPLEDYLHDEYLNQRLDNIENTTLLDCFIFGLLKQKQGSKLRVVDFTKFEKDRRLCRELCRLPILWMKLCDRTPENIHDLLSETLDITKDKVQKFLNRIAVVYSNIDAELEHGRKTGPLTFIVNMKVCMDDVPIGLGLQCHTPFRFISDRLWIKQLSDICFLSNRIHRIFDLSKISHLELEHNWQSSDDQSSLLYLLKLLPQLSAVSLPRCIDVDTNHDVVEQVNRQLRRMKHLQRLNFSYCNLRGYLVKLLDGITQKLVYFNLKDCRLSQEDILFLSYWPPLFQVKELNLSCNNLEGLEETLLRMIRSMYFLVCLSVSYCGFPFESQIQLITELSEYDYIKVLCMQGYTPLPWSQVHDLLFYSSQIISIQKLLLFPEVYAYPGNTDTEREENKKQMILLSYRYLRGRRRLNLQLE